MIGLSCRIYHSGQVCTGGLTMEALHAILAR